MHTIHELMDTSHNQIGQVSYNVFDSKKCPAEMLTNSNWEFLHVNYFFPTMTTSKVSPIPTVGCQVQQNKHLSTNFFLSFRSETSTPSSKSCISLLTINLTSQKELSVRPLCIHLSHIKSERGIEWPSLYSEIATISIDFSFYGCTMYVKFRIRKHFVHKRLV